jgi:hypothetical protein
MVAELELMLFPVVLRCLVCLYDPELSQETNPQSDRQSLRLCYHPNHTVSLPGRYQPAMAGPRSLYWIFLDENPVAGSDRCGLLPGERMLGQASLNRGKMRYIQYWESPSRWFEAHYQIFFLSRILGLMAY